ncbi:MAG: hypothetical protein ACP5I7_05275, partial [Sulfolobales archaeon]
VRYGSAIPTSEELILYGEGKWRIYQGENGEYMDISRHNSFIFFTGDIEPPKKILLLGERIKYAKINELSIDVEADPRGTIIRIPPNIKRDFKIETII